MVTKSCMPYGNSFVMLCSISFIIYIDFILIFGEVTINIQTAKNFRCFYLRLSKFLITFSIILQHPFPHWYNLNLEPLAFQLPLILISYNHRLL